MAKRIVPRQGEMQEQPQINDEVPVNVEAQLEAETGHDVVKTGDNPPTFVETDKPVTAPVDDSEDCYIFNEDTGELRVVHTRAGYAPAPMPFGFRLAKPSEIPGK